MIDQASANYLSDISHAFLSSTEAAACSVEPGSTEDVREIVRYPDPTHQHLLTHIFIAAYRRFKPNAVCSERWRTRHESGIFFDERRTDCDVALQRDHGQFHVWDS